MTLNKEQELKQKDRLETIRTSLKQRVKRAENEFFEIAKLLYEVSNQGMYKSAGCSTMSEWLLTADTGVSPAQSMRLLAMLKRAKRLNIPEANLRGIGSTKALLAINAPRQHVEQLLSIAPTSTIIQMQASAKELRNIRNVYSVSFTGLSEAQFNLAHEAVEKARSVLRGEPTNADCLHYMLRAFVEDFQYVRAA